jgi:manganese/zinc/iron transport system permease protein
VTLLAAFQWLPMDTWIVAVAAMAAMSCALLGNFLVLRRMSMMGDAISHAVLPGLAAAFLLTGSRDSLMMLGGAAVVGVLTAVFTEWIRAAGKVDEGASMGVVFTVLFAAGLILIRQAADRVDLDPDCVLYGAIEFVALDTRTVLGFEAPRAAVTVGATLAVNLLFVILFFKELRITSFDPMLATTLGLNARLVHYALMTLVAITTVTSFESVGSILVIAMLIVPAAAAQLLTERLSTMIVVSLVLAAGSALLGHGAALLVPGWFGFADESASTAGMIGVVAGLLFVLAMLASPRHGLISRALHRAALSVRIAREDLLGLLYRLEERGGPVPVRAAELAAARGAGASAWAQRMAIRALLRDGQFSAAGDAFSLTPAGRAAARELVRSHRLWETYLEQELHVPSDHVHDSAGRLEHVSDRSLSTRLSTTLGDPARDPHGKVIPSSEAGGGS